MNKEMVRLHSIFNSIQGEGPFIGCPAYFIRLAGCNLTCDWCDTDHSYKGQLHVECLADLCDLSKDPEWKFQVFSRPESGLIVITGGEPLYQPGVGRLARLLINLDYTVQIETNGVLWIPTLPYGAKNFHIVCSPKFPFEIHPMIKAYAKIFKIPVDGGAAIEQQQWIQEQVNDPMMESRIWFHPVMYKDDKRRTRVNTNLAIDMCKGLDMRLSIQLHKYLDIE